MRIAANIAEALDYAHRQGVIHRDIKPANVLLQHGKPVISDFGIALAVGAAGGGRLTETGLSLGTPHYMSPEQATGDLNVGPATDIYALGCVLYEMLVGEPPYTGSTAQAVLGKIIAGELTYPSSQRASIPPNVDATIARSLEKIAADRFPAASDFATALFDPEFTNTGGAVAAASSGVGLWNPLSMATTSAAAVFALLALWLWLRPAAPRQAGSSYAVDVALPADQLLAIPTARAYPFDVSPDGRMLVYAGIREGVTRLYLRRLDSFDFVEIEGTEGARQPFFSWDGSQIGFFARGRLMRVPVDGGSPIFIADAPGFPVGAAWGPTGIVFARAGNLFRVSPSGGEPSQMQLEGLGPNVQNLLSGGTWPSYLPDGEHILVSASAVEDSVSVPGSASGELAATPGPHLMAIHVATGEIASRITTGSQGQYVPTGHLLFFGGGGSVRAIPFDSRTLRATGDPFPLIDDVVRGAAGGAGFFRASRSGTVVHVRGGYERSLVLVDRNGRESLLTPERSGFRLPHFSPDGSAVAVGVDGATSSLWRYDVATGRGIALSGGGPNSRFHPDGRLFSGSGTFAERRPEPGPRVLIEWPDPPTWSSHWSRDGATLLVQSFGADTGYDIYALSLSDTTLAPVLVTPADEDEAHLSPGGDWIIYQSDRTGQSEIYLARYPDMSETQPVSNGGGVSPLWSHDGSEIYYRSGDRVMAVSVSLGTTISLGAPEVLFRGPYDHSQNLNWDVDPSGRFVMVRPDPGSFRQFRVWTDVSGVLEGR